MVIDHFIEEIDILNNKKLYISSLWYCRFLMDVILHQCIKEGIPEDALDESWDDYNKVIRQDQKVEKVCEILGKRHIDVYKNEELNRMITSVRLLERGKMNLDIIEREALNAKEAIVKLANFCNRLVA